MTWYVRTKYNKKSSLPGLCKQIDADMWLLGDTIHSHLLLKPLMSLYDTTKTKYVRVMKMLAHPQT